MDKRLKISIIGFVTVTLFILIGAGILIVNKLTPSKEVLPLTDYYQVNETEVLVILQDRIYEKKGLLIDGEVYIDYDTVATTFNKRFYWDKNENVLTYTTPTEILLAEVGKSEYSVTKSMIKTSTSVSYPIVKLFADEVYVALKFVEGYSDFTYQVYENPNRIVIQYVWGDHLYTEVVKPTQLRVDASIKSDILKELVVGDSLLYVDKEEAPKKGFAKVMTEDGVIGYVKEKQVKQSFYKTLTSDFVPPVYTAQTRANKINLVFHQVFNTSAIDSLGTLIKKTKNVNVVSPTWFSVIDDEGSISSLATYDYVEKANDLGLEVWALVDDFNENINIKKILSTTSSRENLSNNLIQAAMEYKLNGINIDFEKIPSDAGEDYIQFLRELSVKCRNNGIVLSVDSYVPAPYTAYYDREEQGVIVDYLIVMAYDEHYAGSDVAGPVASIGFLTNAIHNIKELAPSEKVIMAIPFYTRLWKEDSTGKITSEAYGMAGGENILKDNGVEPEWDANAGTYYGEYTKDGDTYRIWLEEEESIELKMKAIYDGNFAGIASWKLGLEKESIWNIIIKYLN